MGGIFALILAFVAFAVAIAMPLFAQRWKTLGTMVAGAVLFFGFVTYDLPHPDGITQVLADSRTQADEWFLQGKQKPLSFFGLAIILAVWCLAAWATYKAVFI